MSPKIGAHPPKVLSSGRGTPCGHGRRMKTRGLLLERSLISVSLFQCRSLGKNRIFIFSSNIPHKSPQEASVVLWILIVHSAHFYLKEIEIFLGKGRKSLGGNDLSFRGSFEILVPKFLASDAKHESFRRIYSSFLISRIKR